jgi:predicted MFS family arabinose efflux permease
MIASHYPEAMRSRALGLHQSGQLVGVVAGGWFGGWAADHIGWRQAFWIASLVGVAYCGVLWFGIRGRGLAVRNAASTSASGSAAALFRNPCYAALSVTFAAFCAMQWIFFAWFPTFLQERFAMSMTSSGWNGTLFVQTSTIVGILAGGALADKLRAKWRGARLYVAAAGVLLCAPFAYLTFSSGDIWTARLCSAAFGVFGGALAANAFSGAYDLTGDANRGLAGGILNGIGGVASGAMIYLAGIWKDTIGFSGMLVWMMLFAMLASVMLAAVVYAKFERPSTSRA